MTVGRGTEQGARLIVGVAVAVSLLCLSACSGTDTARPATTISGGGTEVRSARGLYKVGKPYRIKGVWYYPQIDYDYVEEGVASWYGPGFHGKATANGETYDQNDMTAAHRTLPMPSVVRVTNLENGRSIKVRINDRGPFAQNRIIDMSRRGAQLLGFHGAGTARVRVEVDAEESRQIAIAMTGTDYPVGGTMVASRQPTTPIDGATPPVPVVAASSIEPAYVTPTYEAPAVAAAETAGATDPFVASAVAPVEVGQTSIGAEPQVQWTPPPPDYPANGTLASSPYAPVDATAVVASNDPAPAEYAAVPPPAVERQVAAYQSLPIPPKPSGPAYTRPVKPAPAANGSHNAYVQAGAFASRDNADRVRQRLSRLGPVAVVDRNAGGQSLYRVRVGPLASVSEAERLLTAVIEAGYPGSHVVVE